jgi:predicted nucleic acid-binding protein
MPRGGKKTANDSIMRLIVDANIVFSGLLNSQGKIGDLLINSGKHLTLIAPEFLQSEIFKHYSKIAKISGLTPAQIRESGIQICKDISFISEEQIKPAAWEKARTLVAEIDPKDIHYLAYAHHFRCKLWSGDKALMNGLKKKGFTRYVTTDELFRWRSGQE